jgi:DNA-directed RNA polymerase specialized sigma24 family protein
MNEQDLGPVIEARELMAEDTALQLFQIAALMLGDEQEAVSLVEEVVAKVEADPCAEGTLAYAEARTLLVRTALQRMAGLYPEAFAVPASRPADAVCIETDDLEAAGLSGDQFSAMISGAGMREWLERLAPALRAIFVLRAVAGQDGEQTAESLRQSGATGAQAWRRDEVGTAYRQALCSLATCLMSAQTMLVPA